MKKILVPTDFSPVADNAMRFAIEIAAKFKSELYLYHVYSFDRFNYNLDFPEDQQPFTKQMEYNMKRAELKYKKRTTEAGLSMQALVERADIFSLFNSIVEKHRINLIVMGSKGATGLQKVIFGSVAATALDMAQVPVLVVPPQHSFSTLQHIVLAMDHNEFAENMLLPLQKLAFQFGSKVTILNVNAGSNEHANQKIPMSLEGVEATYREVPISSSINESINKFVRQSGCDLLCMIRREKGFFESIFQKSITKVQVFNSQIPLLVLPDNM